MGGPVASAGPGDSWPKYPLPADLHGHSPQHEEGPTWCKDCGEFYFSEPCPSPGAGRFDTTGKIVDALFGRSER